MRKCKKCGATLSETAKFCSVCGEKAEERQFYPPSAPSPSKGGRATNKPIYYKWWFWLIVAIVVLAILLPNGEASDDQTTTTTAATTTTANSQKYLVVSVSKLVDDLENNALKAKETYDGKYVEITGRVDVIDASGLYISLYPEDNEWAFTGVQCYIKNDEQEEFVKNISTGDVVTLRGKITDVGEILGYSLNIHEFVD